MKKKLLAGILALALCSTNMPPQTIFAGEFTSGTPEVVSEEETPEIFTNEEQEAAGETNEDLFVFSSEEAPEFNDTPDEAMAAAENAQNGVIDLTNNIAGGVYTIISAGDYKFTCKESLETSNRIVVDGKNISAEANINIYLDNVNIKTSVGPALKIDDTVNAKVTIYLTGTNNLITTKQFSAGLQKDNEAQLIITSASDTTTGILKLGIAVLAQLCQLLRTAGRHIVKVDLNQTLRDPDRDHKNQPLLFSVPVPPQSAGYTRSDT